MVVASSHGSLAFRKAKSPTAGRKKRFSLS
jgi:hypothetical protein